MQQLLAQLWHSFLFKFYRIASLRTVALKWSSRNIFISTSFLQCYAHLSKSPLGPKVDRASFPKGERRELHGVGHSGSTWISFYTLCDSHLHPCLCSRGRGESSPSMPLVPITLQSWPGLSAPSLP